MSSPFYSEHIAMTDEIFKMQEERDRKREKERRMKEGRKEGRERGRGKPGRLNQVLIQDKILWTRHKGKTQTVGCLGFGSRHP